MEPQVALPHRLLAVLKCAEALAARGGPRAGGLQVQALEGRGGGVEIKPLNAPAGALQAHVVEPRDSQAYVEAGSVLGFRDAGHCNEPGAPATPALLHATASQHSICCCATPGG